MDNYRLLDKYFKKKKQTKKDTKNMILSYLNKSMIVFLITIITLIATKLSSSFKLVLKNYVYEENIPFISFNNFYNKYLGGILPFSNNVAQEVFNEKLTYQDVSTYLDGIKLQVTTQYLVPALNDGIVIFIGEKEGYGKTVIIQENGGVEVWYGNINNVGVNLYDYVSEGSLIGEVNQDTLYLAFVSEGTFEDYKKYLQ